MSLEQSQSFKLPNSSTYTRKNYNTDGGRPVSFYDNYIENGTSSNRSVTTLTNNENITANNDYEKSPTQEFCLKTTVPQNILVQNIAKKHTPTRNSLRHSRMIALNKNGKVPKKYLPAIIRYHKLAKSLLGLIVLLGSALCVLSLWLLVWAPNIRYRDNPYWSGVPVLLSGMIGLTLICCFKKEYPGMKRSYFVYSIKVLSISLSSIGAATSFIACAFAIMHLISLYTMACAPPDNLDTTCICFTSQIQNTTSGSIQSYHYVDLSCVEVDNILTILIIFSCGTTFFCGILEVWYVYLHWASRYVYAYSKVRTEDSKPTVLSNTL